MENKIIRKELFGFNFISTIDNREIIENIINHSDEYNNKLPFMITPNVDQLVKFNDPKIEYLKSFYQKSEYILPDGQPIVWSSKLFGKALASRLAGSDFFLDFWNELKQLNSTALLVVPNQLVADYLEKEYSYCKCYVPPMFKVDDTEGYDIVRAEIKELLISFSPKYFFIGLGFPKQELLAKDIYEEMINKNIKFPLTLLLGASFEFYVGEVKRAPLWMQKNGLEWFYRFLQEPKRMFRRYFIDDTKFLLIVIKEYFKK